MTTETLYSIKGHTYGNKWRPEGSSYEARPNHVGVLVTLGRASRTPPTVIQFPVSTKAHEVDDAPEADADEKDILRAEFALLFGKSAAGRMSVETLRQKIQEFKAENE